MASQIQLPSEFGASVSSEQYRLSNLAAIPATYFVESNSFWMHSHSLAPSFSKIWIVHSALPIHGAAVIVGKNDKCYPSGLQLRLIFRLAQCDLGRRH